MRTFEYIKNEAMWGTYGKGGAEHCAGTCPEHQLFWKKLVDCDTEHLQAILRTQRHIVGHPYTELIHSILNDRGVKPEKFNFEAASEFEWKVRQAMKRVSV
jgi:hypothetical protein